MIPRRARRGLLPAAVVVLLLLRYVGGVDWGARAALGLLVGYAVLTLGVGSFRPLRVRESAGPAVDVVEDGGIPVYSCTECGTQLILLRRGSSKAPRHCGETMRFAIVPASDDFEGVHDREGPDYPDTIVPDYPPDDLRG